MVDLLEINRVGNSKAERFGGDNELELAGGRQVAEGSSFDRFIRVHIDTVRDPIGYDAYPLVDTH